MNEFIRKSCALTLTTLLAACAPAVTTAPRGSLMMKIDATTAHVRTREFELSVGDRVHIVRRVCGPPGKTGPVCRDQQVSEGIVVEVMNPRDAVVRFAPGADFAEGDQVEKETRQSEERR